MTHFQRRYPAATPFDPRDPADQLGEAARRHLLDSAAPLLASATSHDDIGSVLGGLLVGVAQIMQACLDDGDEADAAIRASILQLVPWAVDMARSAQGKGPLFDA